MHKELPCNSEKCTTWLSLFVDLQCFEWVAPRFFGVTHGQLPHSLHRHYIALEKFISTKVVVFSFVLCCRTEGANGRKGSCCNWHCGSHLCALSIGPALRKACSNGSIHIKSLILSLSEQIFNVGRKRIIIMDDDPLTKNTAFLIRFFCLIYLLFIISMSKLFR